MPLLVSEIFDGDTEVFGGAVYAGEDLSFTATLADDQRTVVSAINSYGQALSRVCASALNGSFPSPQELTARCNDDRNLRALMLPGDEHHIELAPQEDGQTGYQIRYLKIWQPDYQESEEFVERDKLLSELPPSERMEMVYLTAGMMTVARAVLGLEDDNPSHFEECPQVCDDQKYSLLVIGDKVGSKVSFDLRFVEAAEVDQILDPNN